jgi:hypothetical protein
MLNVPNYQASIPFYDRIGNWPIILFFRPLWPSTNGSNSLLRLNKKVQNGNTIRLSSVEVSKKAAAKDRHLVSPQKSHAKRIDALIAG